MEQFETWVGKFEERKFIIEERSWENGEVGSWKEWLVWVSLLRKVWFGVE